MPGLAVGSSRSRYEAGADYIPLERASSWDERHTGPRSTSLVTRPKRWHPADYSSNLSLGWGVWVRKPYPRTGESKVEEKDSACSFHAVVAFLQYKGSGGSAVAIDWKMRRSRIRTNCCVHLRRWILGYSSPFAHVCFPTNRRCRIFATCRFPFLARMPKKTLQLFPALAGESAKLRDILGTGLSVGRLLTEIAPLEGAFCDCFVKRMHGA